MNNVDDLTSKFQEMGARVKMRPAIRHSPRWEPAPLQIDIMTDKHGQYFDLRVWKDPGIDVLDVSRRDRHLLLMVRLAAQRRGLPEGARQGLRGPRR